MKNLFPRAVSAVIDHCQRDWIPLGFPFSRAEYCRFQFSDGTERRKMGKKKKVIPRDLISASAQKDEKI